MRTTTTTKSRVRHTYVTKSTYAFIYSYVWHRWTWYLYVPYIYTRTHYIVRGTSWYQPVIAVKRWNISLTIWEHITTKLHELKTTLYASRGEWRCKYGVPTDALGAEIDGRSVACNKSQCTHTCKETGLRHRVSPCRSAYFASPWWLLTWTSLT